MYSWESMIGPLKVQHPIMTGQPRFGHSQGKCQKNFRARKTNVIMLKNFTERPLGDGGEGKCKK